MELSNPVHEHPHVQEHRPHIADHPELHHPVSAEHGGTTTTIPTPGYQAMDALRVGSDVLFVLPGGPHKGEARPAIVVHVVSKGASLVNLQVLTDGTNDGHGYALGIYWATSVKHSETREPGTWHWPD